MIQKVAIRCHTGKPEAVRLAKQLHRALAKRVSIVPLDRAEILFVLGGDGTILAAAPDAARLGVPMIGVNVGRLGFLTEFSGEEILPGIDGILNEKF